MYGRTTNAREHHSTTPVLKQEKYQHEESVKEQKTCAKAVMNLLHLNLLYKIKNEHQLPSTTFGLFQIPSKAMEKP